MTGSFRFTAAEFLRALRLRGPLACARVALSGFADRSFDRELQVDTAGVEPNRENWGHAYRGVRVKPFARLLKELALDPTLGFVDYGSGKGRALMLAAGYGFEKVTGIERSEKLLNLAKENLARAGSRWPNVNWNFVNEDAAHFTPANEDGVFFMYDSFDFDKVSACLSRIAASYNRSPRKVTWIYHNNFLDSLEGIKGAGAWNVRRHVIQGNYFFVSNLKTT